MSESQFENVHEFGIDAGELAGFTVEAAFVLGIEWQMIRGKAERHVGPFSATVHAANADRIRSMLAKVGRTIHKLTYHHDDQSEQWMHLIVEAKGATP